MKPDKKHIGLRIKELREENGMDILEFSKAISIDNSTLGKIEKGRANPTLEHLLEISSKFSVSVDWILNGGERFASKKGSISKDGLQLKLYELALSSLANEKANAEMIKRLFVSFNKMDELSVNSLHSSLVERFLTEESNDQL